jgi:hypothetical protein
MIGASPTGSSGQANPNSTWQGQAADSSALTPHIDYWLRNQTGGGYDANGKWDASLNPAFVNGQFNVGTAGSRDALQTQRLVSAVGAGREIGMTAQQVAARLGLPEQEVAGLWNDPNVVSSGATFRTDNPQMFQQAQQPAPRPTTGQQFDPANPGNTPLYLPDLNRQVPQDALIENRIQNLLKADANGGFTNPVVRQAVDRAMQMFNARGLMNSSMAVQAGYEAAVSKAIEIAGPDAQRVFEQSRANQDAINTFARDQVLHAYDMAKQNDAQAHDRGMQQDKFAHDRGMQDDDQEFKGGQTAEERAFTLRQNYIEAQDAVNARYNQAVNQINASNMTPEDRDVAIRQAAAARDGELVYVNNLFSKMQGWSSDWLTSGVPLSGQDTGASGLQISTMTNRDALQNIANDPAQPATTREQARHRLAELDAAAANAPAPAPAAAPAGMIGDAGYNGIPV